MQSIAYAIFGGLDYAKDLTVEQAKRRRAYMNDPRYAALAAKKWLLENEGMGTPAEIAGIDQGLKALAAEFKAQEKPLANNELLAKAAVARADAVYGTDSGMGRFVTDTAISAGTFAANLALSFGNPAVALTLMGIESGAQAAYDIGRQGGTFERQLQGGVASGVLAALIQKIPLDMVRKAWQTQGASGVQRFVKAFVKGALPEGAEGFADTVAGNMADRVALGKEADMGKAEFWRDSLKQAVYAAAIGAVSGGVIAGVPAGFRGLGTRVAAGTRGQEGELSTANGTTNNIAEGAGKVSRYFKDEQLKTEPNAAYFWSGNSNGIGGKDFAMDHAAKNGGTTLEGLMKSQSIEMPTWDIADQSSKKAWEYASGKYAGQVSGDIHALIGTTQRQNSIWRTIELPELMKNPYVSKIILVDPETLTETVIFRR